MEKQRNSSMEEIKKNPRILCLHGFRTSAEILKKLILQWPESILKKLDLVFLDGPYPAQGKSAVEGIFDPPYYEWFQADKDYREFYNFEECVEFIEDYMIKHGPFDGVLGFSQGAVLAATFPGMQREGVALTKVPELKFLIIISGAVFGEGILLGCPKLAANAFSSPIIYFYCLSFYFKRNLRFYFLLLVILKFVAYDFEYIEETGVMKEQNEAILRRFIDPVVIRHSEGHTIPRLGMSLFALIER
ncbi:hypothetical protein M9H77_19644 [Catharanthus roseus]|uniref:Uncharacterized protein n=1 Tax=Catharanthus roseus TaxID=4058 RepID=A0ACC0BAW8_CATRO|nr:hypothetical protein M9H77_19644 [Catharanthus roseus]